MQMEITGVMYDRKIPRKLKSKLCKEVIRPVLLYGAESWAVGKKEEELVARTEMRMLRRIVGVTLMNKEKNEKISKECGVAGIKLKMREARLRWFGHVERRGRGVKRAMQMEVDGSRRRRGRPKKRWIDGVMKDMEEVKMTREKAVDRGVWKRRTRTADPSTA